MSTQQHRWTDVALLPTQQGGAGWMPGIRYACACGVEKRMVGVWSGHGAKTDASHTDTRAIYFVRGRRVDRMPECRA